MGWTYGGLFETLPPRLFLPENHDLRFAASIAMTSFLRSVGTLFQSGRWAPALALGLLMGLLIGICGCQTWNLRGDGFDDDELATTARESCPADKDVEYWSYSEKARQIERNLQ